jgi:hypothetical protein
MARANLMNPAVVHPNLSWNATHFGPVKVDHQSVGTTDHAGLVLARGSFGRNDELRSVFVQTDSGDDAGGRCHDR